MICESHCTMCTFGTVRVSLFVHTPSHQPYILLHYHTNASTGSPGVNILKNLFAITDERYAQNLHCAYLVHTSFWLKTSMLFGSNPFSSNPLLKGKAVTLVGTLS